MSGAADRLDSVSPGDWVSWGMSSPLYVRPGAMPIASASVAWNSLVLAHNASARKEEDEPKAP